MRFKAINHIQLSEMLESGQVTLLDIRDFQSYQEGHIPNAKHVVASDLDNICNQLSPDKVVLVYCYHGISSQSIAQHLVDRGFSNVFSLTGGFEVWRDHHWAAE